MEIIVHSVRGSALLSVTADVSIPDRVQKALRQFGSVEALDESGTAFEVELDSYRIEDAIALAGLIRLSLRDEDASGDVHIERSSPLDAEEIGELIELFELNTDSS